MIFVIKISHNQTYAKGVRTKSDFITILMKYYFPSGLCGLKCVYQLFTEEKRGETAQPLSLVRKMNIAPAAALAL